MASEQKVVRHNQFPFSQSLLIILMITAVITVFSSVLGLISPEFPWLALPIFTTVICIEAMLTTRWLRTQAQLILSRSSYRAAEFVVWAIAARIVSFLLIGGLPSIRELLLQPSLFFDGFYVMLLILTAVSASWCIGLSDLFSKLAITPAEERYYTEVYATNASDRPINYNRSDLVPAFFQQWLIGGVILVIFVSISTLNVRELGSAFNLSTVTRIGLRPEVLISLLTYFLSGFWLLSQARLAAMQVRWLTSRIPTNEVVIQKWRRTSFYTVFIIALIAAFLPIGSAAPIGQLINVILGAIIFAIQWLFFLLGSLFIALLGLFGVGNPEQLEEPPPPEFNAPFMPEMIEPGEAPSETSQLIFGGAFWIVMIVVVVIALAFFLRERGHKMPQWAKLWQAIQLWFQQLWRSAATQMAEIRHNISRQQGQAEAEGNGRSPWRYIRVNGLPPREQIRYFYLSAVRRAGDKGVERRPNETPLEYADDLAENWPDAEVDVTELTDAFLKARYSPKNIEEEEANSVKARWKRVRSNLRKRKN